MDDQSLYADVAKQLKDGTPDTPDTPAVDAVPAAAAAAGNIYDDVASELKSGQDDATRQGILENATRKVDPARQAEAIKIAKEKGIPIDVVYDDIDTFRERPHPDIDKIMREAPVTARILADHVKGPVTFTDHEPLSEIERAFKDLGTPQMDLDQEYRKAVADRYWNKLTSEPVLGQPGVLSPADSAAATQERVDSAVQETVDATVGARQAMQIADNERKWRESVDPNYISRGELYNPNTDLTKASARQQIADAIDKTTFAANTPITQEAWRAHVDSFFNSLGQMIAGTEKGAGEYIDMLPDDVKKGLVALAPIVPQLAALPFLSGQDENGKGPLTRAADATYAATDVMFPGDKGRSRDLSVEVTSGVASSLPFFVLGGIGKALGMSPGLVAGIAGALSEGGSAAQDADQAGAETWQKRLALVAGTVAGSLEAAPVDNWFKWLEEAPFRSAIVGLFTRTMVGGGIEAGTEATQTGIEDIVPKLTYDPSRDVLGDMFRAGRAAFFSGGLFGAFGHVAQVYAEKQRDQLLRISDAINRAKTMQIAPGMMTEFIENLKEAGTAPESVTAPVEAVEALFQELDPEAVKQTYGEFLDRINEAKAAGSEVTIPTEKLAELSTLKGYSTFTDKVRIGDSMTVEEAVKFNDEIDKQLKLMEEQGGSIEESPVYKTIHEQLVKAGQSADVAAPVAKLYEAFFTTQAQKVGMKPEELLRRYGLEVASSELDAQEMGPQLDALRKGSTPETADLEARLAAAGIRQQDLAGMSNEQVAQRVAERTLAQDQAYAAGYGEPALKIGDRVFKASDVFPNWPKGDRPEAGKGGMSIADEQAMDAVDLGPGMPEDPFYGHVDILQEARKTLGADVVDKAVDEGDGNHFGFVNAAGEFKSLTETLYQTTATPSPAATPDYSTAVDAASLDASNALSKGQAWQKGRDLKLAMQDRVLTALRALKLDPSVRSAEAIKYLVEVGTKDALAALSQNPNAIGWYDVKTRQALAVMSLVHPEIKTDPNARFAFTWALAVTSNGIKVGKNFELADMVYRRYKKTGQMPTDITAGQAQKAINESLSLFNELQARWGTDALRRFMLTDFKVSEISGIDKELTPSGEFADTLVRGAAILGPKIGNGFFSNLYGVFDALTMDRWLVRTWGRWTGTLIEIDERQVAGARGVLREKASAVDIEQMATRLRAVRKKTKTKGETEVKPVDRERLLSALEAGWDTDEKLDALAMAVQKASQEPAFRAVMNEVPGGKELRTKGNNLAKYLDGQKEQPAGPAERNYIREVFQGILDALKAGNDSYADLTMADLQAVLWYAEKRLYETAKEDTVVSDDVADGAVSGYEDEEAPDYANAAAAQARADGVPEDKIKATLNKEAKDGRSTAARSGNDGEAGSAGEAVAGGEGGQQAAARGFARDEKRSFIQRAAIERVRSNRSGDAQSSWSYAGTGGDGRDRPRVLKSLGVRYVDIWKPGPKARAVFKANGIQTPAIYELQTGSAENAARFVSAISDARSTLGPIGEAVHVYPAEEYAGMRLFMTEDGKGGFALKPDGDIVSVFSAKGQGNGRAIMETAVAAGGRKLDCFHTILPEFYSAHGFRGTSRLLWNDEVAQADMPGWDKKAMTRYNNGEPDVVFMVYDPTYYGVYDREATPLFEGDNGYGDALQAQSDAMSAVAEATPTTLNQAARGFITFTKARDKFRITLTGKANLSTFLHESGHFFLEIMQDLAEKGIATPQQVEDLAILKKWMGLAPNSKAGPGARIGVREHEMFARATEAYLMEGKAPSIQLQGAFTRFKSWLVFVYRSLMGLNVQLTDEVRGVMDRLYASDQAIAEARAQVGWQGAPLKQELTGLTDAEYKAYVEAWTKAGDDQSQEADARVMLEAGRELKRVWRDEKIALTKAVEAELAKTRGYRAWKLLEGGEGLQEIRPGWAAIKITPDSIPSEWRRDAAGLTSPGYENGLPLDTVAEILGFRSGEEMLSLIAGARAAQKAIPAKVRAQMEAKHGKMDAAQIAFEASKAVHNKPTMDVLLTEYRAMARKANQNTPANISQILAAQARQRVAGLTRRQLEPGKWRRAEVKAATEAGALAAKGDAMGAFLAKRRQMIAAHMAKASLEAQDRIEKIRDYLSTFETDRRRAQLGRAGDMYLDGVDQILENIELKNVSIKDLKARGTAQARKALADIVQQAIADDEPIAVPPEVVSLGKKNYSLLTVAELEAVNDAVKNLWTLAKLKNQLKSRQGKIALDKAMAEIEETAKAYLGERRQPDNLNPTMIDNAINSLRWTRARLVKMEFLFSWLDGKPDGGLAHQLIYQPIADARHDEYVTMKDLSARILDPLRNMPKEQKQRWDTMRTFMGQNMKGANIIAVALNLGNEQNKRKLLDGYGWNEQQLVSELARFMTKADWDMVQRIWDGIDTLWPRIAQVAKNATGLAPDKVVPSSVQTPFGEYSGGYYPIVYDPFRTQRQAENQEKNASANGLFANNYLRPTLDNGFTKKRTGYVAPIYLSLDVLSKHLAETVHYITHYEAVKQADKIRSHPTFQRLVTETMGAEFWKAIRPWLQDIASNATQRRYPEFGENVMRQLRVGSTIAAMGFNIGTAIKQLFGITSVLDAVGPLHWATGVQKAWLSPKALTNWRFARENSQELNQLIHDYDRDVKQVNDAYVSGLHKSIPLAVAKTAFAHIGYFQLVVNVATWHAAYEQATAKKMTHAQAVMHADSVVRKTQSAGAIKDLADVQRSGEATKLLTMFYSWFSVLYNRLEDIHRETNSVKDIPRAAYRLTVLAILPAILNVGYNLGYAALFGGDDDDEEYGLAAFATDVGLESMNQIVGAVPLIRNVISFGDHAGVNIPAFSKIEQMQRVATSIKDWISEGEAPTRREVRTMVGVAGTLAKVPVPAIYNLIDDLFGARTADK